MTDDAPPSTPVVPAPDLPVPNLPPAGGVPAGGMAGGGPPVTLVPLKIRRESGGAEEADEAEADGVAPFNGRVIAAVIDAVVFAGLYLAMVWVLPGFAERLAWVVGVGYWVARDSLAFLGGQSIGKKAMKMKVVTLDGQSLVNRWETALIRNIALAVPFFALIELYVLLSRDGKPGQGRRLGDEWAKTRVIIADEPVADA